MLICSYVGGKRKPNSKNLIRNNIHDCFSIFDFSIPFPLDRSTGDYLYRSPGVIPTKAYLLWVVSFLSFSVIPLTMFRTYTIVAGISAMVCIISSCAAMYLTGCSVKIAKPVFKANDLNADVMIAAGATLGSEC